MESLQQPAKYTYDDLLVFPDDGKRREIIDGELFVSPSPSLPHQIVVGNLHFAIRTYLVSHPVGHVFLAPLDVVFSKFDVVEPDLLFVSKGRREILTEANVQGSPDLAIEVLSPSSRRLDEIKKRTLYERFEVLEYWIAYPIRRSARVYRRTNPGVPFERIAEYSADAGDSITSPIFPGLVLPLAKAFEDLPTE